MPEFITTADVAARLGMTVRNARRLARLGLPSVGRRGRTRHPWPEAKEWHDGYVRAKIQRRKERQVRTRERRERVSPPRRCRYCAAVVGRQRSVCDDCRLRLRRARALDRIRRVGTYSRKSTPDWVSEARARYEAGEIVRSIAASRGLSSATVQAWAKIDSWDRALHARNAEALRYPWRDAVRPLWEAGERYETLSPLTGLAENTLAALAKRWGWDGAARWAAIWRAVRGGVGKDEAARTRKRRHRRERRVVEQGSRELPLGFVRRLRAEARLCPYCGQPMRASEVTLDHVDPIARGGTNDPDNLSLCCAECNRSKGDAPLVLWLARRARRRANAA